MSPPLAERAKPSLSIDTNTSANIGPTVPNVVPYQKEQAEERKLAERLTIPEVDLGSLPPPPTRKDREAYVSRVDSAIRSPSSKNRALSSTQPSIVTTPQESAHTVANVPSTDVQHIPITLSNDDLGPVASDVSPAVVGETVKETSILSEAETVENPNTGITGKFDYNVQVNYAPPPKPHRGPGSAPSLAPSKSAIRPQAPPCLNETLGPRPPALPGRETSSRGVESSSATGETPVSNFLPPPAPYRRTESMSSEFSKNPVSSSAPARSMPNLVSSANRDLSSFPPPPKPKRPDISGSPVLKETESNENKKLSSSTPHGRGRLSMANTEEASFQDSTNLKKDLSNSQVASNETNSNEHPQKKNPPPKLKPKPKKLSTANFRSSSEELESDQRSAAINGQIGDISNELAQFKLKKTGSGFLNNKSIERSEVPPSKVKTPPKIPPKRDSLKKAPPVPAKSSTFKLNASSSQQKIEPEEDNNPFSIYLKSAVPLENDRLHR